MNKECFILIKYFVHLLKLIATPQLMEKMDYEDNTDNTDGYYDNTAKKCRLSSYMYESSTASLQSVQSSSSSIDHSTSQIYTGNFGRVSSVICFFFYFLFLFFYFIFFFLR